MEGEECEGVRNTVVAVEVGEIEDVGGAAEGLAGAAAEEGLALLVHGGHGEGAGCEGEDGGEERRGGLFGSKGGWVGWLWDGVLRKLVDGGELWGYPVSPLYFWRYTL